MSLTVACDGGCWNSGECTAVNGQAKCICPSSWTGSRCQEGSLTNNSFFSKRKKKKRKKKRKQCQCRKGLRLYLGNEGVLFHSGVKGPFKRGLIMKSSRSAHHGNFDSNTFRVDLLLSQSCHLTSYIVRYYIFSNPCCFGSKAI